MSEKKKITCELIAHVTLNQDWIVDMLEFMTEKDFMHMDYIVTSKENSTEKIDWLPAMLNRDVQRDIRKDDWNELTVRGFSSKLQCTVKVTFYNHSCSYMNNANADIIISTNEMEESDDSIDALREYGEQLKTYAMYKDTLRNIEKIYEYYIENSKNDSAWEISSSIKYELEVINKLSSEAKMIVGKVQ